jgi:hypothetical protein
MTLGFLNIVIPAKAHHRHSRESTPFVIPAKAGIQCLLDQRRWVPAFAGTTNQDLVHG